MKINNLQKSINDSSCEHEYINIIIDNFLDHNKKLLSNNLNEKEKNEYFRNPVLLTIKILLERNIIKIHDPKNGEIWSYSPTESINKVKSYWKKDSIFPEFYNMPSFSWTTEFKNKILNDGYKLNTNWSSYLEKSKYLQELLYVNKDIFLNRLKEI
ncbi:hypothetical protein [Tenacibaculum piscium]|uniref:hypothetical protein n=1 Tax=Tenacibaculum piscium TaxID=1458515 RepID=UPI00187B3FCD|nr:hypothetical protein [Tenacibaculum piscium]MBE7686615.1 hypothetical protein [Tenacibaculum piscium]MBE7691326.1 hypothetical protein [Tenacibaculum piscium]